MILVDIYVPAVDDTFDFMLDENASIAAIMIEISEMLTKKTGSGKLSDKNEFVLYDAERQTPLISNRSLFECGVGDGDRLIIV